ncbi:MAG: hypothetical protein CMJ76_13065 [Planctomycetaceae bacterium]|nr:hypothetical protein [Planctomycetaceae bacterium]
MIENAICSYFGFSVNHSDFFDLTFSANKRINAKNNNQQQEESYQYPTIPIQEVTLKITVVVIINTNF